MRLLLLSGGSGKRLWPLSNESRSKQFIKVLKSEDGMMESMIQRVWGQMKAQNLTETAYITTTRAQVEMLRSQLDNDVPIIVEPERRDTFAAIALAASYLYSVEKVDLEETIAVFPVDPFVEDRFFQSISYLDQVLNESKANIA